VRGKIAVRLADGNLSELKCDMPSDDCHDLDFQITVEHLELAHSFSRKNRGLSEGAGYAGCFYCESTFHPSEIAEWTDQGLTAVCPCCGIDSVLFFTRPLNLAKLLHAMEAYWFGKCVRRGEDWVPASQMKKGEGPVFFLATKGRENAHLKILEEVGIVPKESE